MPRIKLTKSAVAAIKAPDPSGKQTIHWDSTLPGFGVLASGTTKVKSYIVQGRVAGRARRVTVGPCTVMDLDKARERAKDILSGMWSGIDPKQARRAAQAATVTLRDVLDDYVTGNRRLRERTAGDYKSVIERYLDDWLDKPMAAITPEMVEARHEKIAADVAARNQAKAKQKGKRVNPLVNGRCSANGCLRILRILWNHAVESHPDLPANPVRRLRKRWYPEHRRERMVRPSELKDFYGAVLDLDPLWRDYVLLLMFTGMRRSECAGLEWDDVDFADKVIRLPAAKTKAGRKLDLPMSDYVNDLLVGRRSIGKDVFVFPGVGESGHIEEPRVAFDAIAEACGIRVSPHDLRRTFMTIAESTEMSVYALKGLVNHSMGASGDVTGGYLVGGSERLREPMQRVTDKLKQLCGIEEPKGEKVAKMRAKGAKVR